MAGNSKQRVGSFVVQDADGQSRGIDIWEERVMGISQAGFTSHHTRRWFQCVEGDEVEPLGWGRYRKVSEPDEILTSNDAEAP